MACSSRASLIDLRTPVSEAAQSTLEGPASGSCLSRMTRAGMGVYGSLRHSLQSHAPKHRLRRARKWAAARSRLCWCGCAPRID